MKIEPGMRLALAPVLEGEQLPDIVCTKCYDDLTKNVSKGVKLRMEAHAKEQNRAAMWKGRVNVVKQGRNLMAQKAYSEAALAYEKYLRILEVVYQLKAGEISPEVFSNSKRSKEMTVITSVYWDLFRIYDMSPRYLERQKTAAAKLAAFAKHSTIYPDIIKRAQAFARTAKNPAVVNSFLRTAGGLRGKCFIATAICTDPTATEVLMLRQYRDLKLRRSKSGRFIIGTYYKLSPLFAQIISRYPTLQMHLRPLLKNIAERMNKSLDL